jgi:hypothetical protein
VVGGGGVGLVVAVERRLHLLQQADAVVELALADRRAQVLDTAGRVVDDQRLVAGAEEAGAEAAVADRDEVRQRELRVAQLRRDQRAETRVDEAADAFLVAGVQVDLGPAVGAFAGAHTADDGPVVHQAGQLREVLADLDAGHGGLDRLELAAVLGTRLQIEGVLVRRAAVHPEKDTGLRPGAGLGGAASEDVQPARQRHGRDADGGQLQPVAAREGVEEHGDVP